MRRLPIGELRPGMVLGQTIYGDTGKVLLRQGVRLSDRYIHALRLRGYAAAYVCDGLADDIAPQEVISDNVRVATRKHVHDLFELVRGNAVTVPAKPTARRTRTNLAATAAPLVAQLSEMVEKIVEEALDAAAVDGIISLKGHDNYSFEHSIEVTVVGVLLGKRLHLPMDTLRQLALGGILHDIGKMYVSKEILNKPGPLTSAEFALVRRHPQIGYDVVKEIMSRDDSLIARHVVLQHHERQNGTGYPRQLRGNNSLLRQASHRFLPGQILLVAEIAAVADTYSALASDRPYRPAMEQAETIDCLQKMAGHHLNREIVRRFLSILPVYPVGSDVVVISGERNGFRGVVVAVNSGAIDRPVIRLLFDPHGNRIDPLEIDTSEEDDVQFATPTKVLEIAS